LSYGTFYFEPPVANIDIRKHNKVIVTPKSAHITLTLDFVCVAAIIW